MSDNKPNEFMDDDLDRSHITLTLEDDSEMDCEVLGIFPVGDKEYIALLPEGAGEDGEVIIYRFTELENDEIQLDNIEDDAEFELVGEAFDEFMDEQEFDDLFDEEDEDEE